MNFIPIIISAIALIVSFYFGYRNSGYARINVFNTIQKMMLEKAKDCNQLYINEYEKWRERKNKVGDIATPLEYHTVINEISISIDLLLNTLVEFRVGESEKFFVKQFWLQLDNRLRKYLHEYKIVLQSEESVQTERIRRIFEQLY